MGDAAIYQKLRNTSHCESSQEFACPVDLKQVSITDQNWTGDMAYIRLHKEFLYLVAFVDLISRNALRWKL